VAGEEHERLLGEFGQGDPVVAGEPVIGVSAASCSSSKLPVMVTPIVGWVSR
jgi:hypothetical protein